MRRIQCERKPQRRASRAVSDHQLAPLPAPTVNGDTGAAEELLATIDALLAQVGA